MLKSDISVNGSQFPEELERYLGELLHERIDVRAFESTRSLPSFIGQTYTLYEAPILGRHCIIVAKLGETSTPADIAKHINIVAFRPELSLHDRAVFPQARHARPCGKCGTHPHPG